MPKPAPKWKRALKRLSVQDAMQEFFAARGGEPFLSLARLWAHWGMVMGADLEHLALPLGQRGEVLIIGGEDNTALQELTLYAPEILLRVNAFLDVPRFSRVQLELLQGRTPLYPPKPQAIPSPVSSARPKPERLGGLMDVLDPATPIGRCYRSYVESFE